MMQDYTQKECIIMADTNFILLLSTLIGFRMYFVAKEYIFIDEYDDGD